MTTMVLNKISSSLSTTKAPASFCWRDIHSVLWMVLCPFAVVAVLLTALMHDEIAGKFLRSTDSWMYYPLLLYPPSKTHNINAIRRRRLRDIITFEEKDDADTLMESILDPRSIVSKKESRLKEVISPKSDETQCEHRCAILFFGLPRAFDTLVLPSLVKNILTPDNVMRCDFFVHYYDQSKEAKGRSNNGGEIHSDAILNLKDIILDKYHATVAATAYRALLARPPVVKFTSDTPESFMKQYDELLQKIHETNDPEGHPLYFPWKEKTYAPSSLDNIIKMWHSIQEVWKLMEETNLQTNRSEVNMSVVYDTVAVLRNDVVYITPLNLADRGVNTFTNAPRSPDNTVTIPGFDKWPVSDRAIYGPYEAVKVWSTRRFDLLDQHVQMMYESKEGDKRGFGLHHERFMKLTLFPEMKKHFLEWQKIVNPEDPLFLKIWESDTWCFMRARAGDEVMVTDCENYDHEGHSLKTIQKKLYHGDALEALELAIGRPCEQAGHEQYRSRDHHNQLIRCRDPATIPEVPSFMSQKQK